MKIFNYLFCLALALLFFSATAVNPTIAAKKRVWGKTIVTSPVNKSPLSVSARLTGWKQYLNVSFKGVSNTKGVNYELVYRSNGIDQGAGGRINASEGNVSRSLFLGTCSHGVCTAHKNISNVRLTVTYLSSSGQSITKNYKVKY